MSQSKTKKSKSKQRNDPIVPVSLKQKTLNYLNQKLLTDLPDKIHNKIKDLIQYIETHPTITRNALIASLAVLFSDLVINDNILPDWAELPFGVASTLISGILAYKVVGKNNILGRRLSKRKSQTHI